MLEIRYRLTGPPGIPHPFDPWFAHAPDAYVFSRGLRFEGMRGQAEVVGVAGEHDPQRFAEDLRGCPTPGATRWELRGVVGEFVFMDSEWQEPIYPGILSPMRVAYDVLGPEAQIDYVIRRDIIQHRCFVPAGTPTDGLWTRLRDELMKYCGFSGTPVKLELERLGPHAR